MMGLFSLQSGEEEWFLGSFFVKNQRAFPNSETFPRMS
jgi:hypothetical protein